MIAPPYMRRLSEVVMMHKLESGLRHIYTEGATDLALVKWFIQRSGLDDTRITDVNDIEFSEEVSRARGLASDSRQRLYVLAEALMAAIPEGRRTVVCVADADLDRLIGGLVSNVFLVHTDFTCMEMYYFNVGTMERFLVLFVRARRITVGLALGGLAGFLSFLFSIRAALKACAIGVSIIPPDKLLRIVGDAVDLERDEYLTRMCNKIGDRKKEESFRAAQAKLQAILAEKRHDQRQCIHGHDWTEALAWIMKHVEKRRDIARTSLIEDALRSNVDGAALSREPLFVELMHRLRKESTHA